MGYAELYMPKVDAVACFRGGMTLKPNPPAIPSRT